MREYLPGKISIDGRNIEYILVTARDYLEAKYEWTDEQIDSFCANNREIYKLINQIMALKQSCYLMLRVSYSSRSLVSDLCELKEQLINDLSEKFNFDFDDQFVEDYGFED